MRHAVWAALLLAGCGYTPPPQTEISGPAYGRDLDACRAAAKTAVNQHDVKTGLAWIAAPVTRWGRIGDATGACMAEKGYGRVRSCTAEELRSNARAGSMVVTAAGILCSDPPRRPI